MVSVAIAYFSGSGHTHLMAQAVAELDAGDWFCQAPKDRLTAQHFGQRITEVTERCVANSLVAVD